MLRRREGQGSDGNKVKVMEKRRLGLRKREGYGLRRREG